MMALIGLIYSEEDDRPVSAAIIDVCLDHYFAIKSGKMRALPVHPALHVNDGLDIVIIRTTGQNQLLKYKVIHTSHSEDFIGKLSTQNFHTLSLRPISFLDRVKWYWNILD